MNPHEYRHLHYGYVVTREVVENSDAVYYRHSIEVPYPPPAIPIEVSYYTPGPVTSEDAIGYLITRLQHRSVGTPHEEFSQQLGEHFRENATRREEHRLYIHTLAVQHVQALALACNYKIAYQIHTGGDLGNLRDESDGYATLLKTGLDVPTLLMEK